MYILSQENLNTLNSLVSEMRNLVGFPAENQKDADIVKYKIDNVIMTLPPVKMAGSGTPENPTLLGYSVEKSLADLSNNLGAEVTTPTADEILAELITSVVRRR